MMLMIETARHLRLTQVAYQLKHRLWRPRLRAETSPAMPHLATMLASPIAKPRCYDGEGRFTFLNVTSTFRDWDMDDYGPLWTYNLNYMDWLEQDGISEEECLRWIDRFVEELPTNHAGLDPYPIALRIINWAKFFSKHPDCLDQHRRDSMYAQTMLLSRSLEYHLLGNHLLEDAYAVFIASLFFGDDRLFRKATTLLLGQLKEQILPDGAHYEQSPMYHCIMLDRLLDCINFAKGTAYSSSVISHLSSFAALMLGHLASIIWKDGSIPLFNDSALGIAPTPEELFDYATRLGLSWAAIPLCECGYRHLAVGGMEATVDIGNITASYQPGHTHADTFNYELRIDGQPIIIDTGISTYNKNERRQYERSTAAHNTVSVGGKDSSRVWGGFRVGRRAKVTVIRDSHEEVVASHNGFGKSIKHQRRFLIENNTLSIEDHVIGHPIEAVSYLHFSPQLHAELISEADGIVKVGQVTIKAEGFCRMTLTQGEASTTYNKTQPCDILAIYFTKHLKYSIKKT